MRRLILLATTSAALASALASTSAFAQYGAIAFDQNNCAWGRAWNYQTAALASAAALTSCGKPGCKVIVQIVPHACGSLAATPNCRGWGAATRATLAEAQNAALQDCAKANTGTVCTAKIGDCNR